MQPELSLMVLFQDMYVALHKFSEDDCIPLLVGIAKGKHDVCLAD